MTLHIDLTTANNFTEGELFAPPPTGLLSVCYGRNHADVKSRLEKLGRSWLKGVGEVGTVEVRKDLRA